MKFWTPLKLYPNYLRPSEAKGPSFPFAWTVKGPVI